MEPHPPLHTVKIDARDLSCPFPILKLGKAIRASKKGDILLIGFTDPKSKQEIPDFCERFGHKIISTEEKEETSFYWIEVKS